VLPKQGFEYIHAKIKSNVKVSPISGGTDIVGCFVGGNMFEPTFAGQINGPMLGMDVDVWDESGKTVNAGQAGELVCRSPFPSMPLRFADDAGGARYRAEYFEYYEGKVWRHGDSVEKTPEGQMVIIGRSDATLNQNGVRIGPVTIYDQLKPFAGQIREAAAVDFTRPDNKQAITILFLALKDGASAVPDDLQKAIKKAVKDNVTPYAIPTEIIAVPGILKTPNGKTAEVVMKKILAGKAVPNASLYGEELVKQFEKMGRELTQKYSA
jgi:acetoacetyl-CoA synthetase